MSHIVRCIVLLSHIKFDILLEYLTEDVFGSCKSIWVSFLTVKQKCNMKQRETITKLRQTNEFHISTNMINFIAPYGNKNKFKFIPQVIVFHKKHFSSYWNILRSHYSCQLFRKIFTYSILFELVAIFSYLI